MTATDTATRTDELRAAYQREQAAENRRLRAENKRLAGEVRYYETVILPAIIKANGTAVIPRKTFDPRGKAYGPRVTAEQNSAGDIIVRLENAT